MNNALKVDNIVKYWAEVARSNPDFEFGTKESQDYIYHDLIFRGVNEADRKDDLREQSSKIFPNQKNNETVNSPYAHPNSTFNNLINLYYNKPTSVFVSPNWQYFCQFISKDRRAREAENHIKVYIPLDAYHVEYGAKLIFDFLEQSNISHISKLGKHIRFDDIVVRLINPEDAEKLINFISNTKYIQEGLIEPNPFAFQKDGIALAVDGNLSYNNTVSKLIDLYIDTMRKENALDTVSRDNFYLFVYSKYKGQFVDYNDSSLQTLFKWKDSEEAQNYYEIVSLVLKASTQGFTYDDFIDHYKGCSNVVLGNQNQMEDVNELLLEAVIELTKRFGHPVGLYTAEKYYDSGEDKYMTKNNNLRSRLASNQFRSRLNEILKTYNFTFMSYTESLLMLRQVDLSAYSNVKVM